MMGRFSGTFPDDGPTPEARAMAKRRRDLTEAIEAAAQQMTEARQLWRQKMRELRDFNRRHAAEE